MPIESLAIAPWIHSCDGGNRANAWSVPRRRLTHWLVVLCLRGHEVIRVEGKEYYVEKGATYCVAPGLLADLAGPEGSQPLWFHVDLVYNPLRAQHPHAHAYEDDLTQRQHWLQPDDLALFGLRLPVLAPPSVRAMARTRLPEALAYWRSGALGRQRAALEVASVLQAWADDAQGEAQGTDRTHILVQAAHIARERLDRISVEQLAEVLGVARSTLSELWQRHYGCAPGQWLRQERLARAARLLAHPTLTLLDIAHLCGWADATALIRAWRAAYGTTPRS